jgi:diacylglycerol kinase (ATP)
MSKTKIAFVINPVSGTRKKDHVPGLIDQILDKNKYEPVIVLTQRAGHATELTREFVAQGVPIVVSVGGDGTVNEIGRALVETNTAMGILPFGSGNGLARHMQIPMDTAKAIELFNHSKISAVDYGKANDVVFFCTCGVGFDAHIGHQFATAPKRGFLSYAKITLREFRNYKPQHYKFQLDKETTERDAFLITFANANQWGNNAFVNPKADIQDGIMEICIAASKFPIWAVPSIAIRLFNKTLDRSKYMTTLKSNSVIVDRESAGIFHFDGEPAETGKTINIKIIKGGLKMVVDQNSPLK